MSTVPMVPIRSFDQALQGLKQQFYRHKRPILWGIAAVVVVGVVTIGMLFAGLPNRNELRTLGDMPQATTLYDVNKRPVFTIFKEYRIEVPLARVSPHLRKAIVAFEDQRFEDHKGYDPFRIFGAAWADLQRGRKAQGASTITQQLARQSFLTREKKYWRKLQEIALAVRIERMYSKEEILELYLNKVYFGDGLYGAEAAARGYFGKSAADLDLAESALLAGLVNAPSVNAPTVNMARAVGRRALVLKAMNDQEIITKDAFERATKEKVTLRDVLRREEPLGQYFKEEVRQQLVKQFGWERLSEGGLRVYTTIDPDMQRAAEATIAKSLEQIEARRAARLSKKPRHSADPKSTRSADLQVGPAEDRLEAALVAMDPRTGEVRAMVGGRDFKASRFNRATQALRQPGSAFKPFVYAAALENGYTPASLVTRLDEPVATLQGAWMPEDEHSISAAMTVRTALRTSSNRAAVRMLEQVGISKTVDQARRMGMGSVPSVPSLALGSGEVTLMAMTSAYSTFADRGQLRPPTLILRVEDAEGNLLFEAKPSVTQVLAPQTAFLMTSMLSDVINYGTAYRARQEGFTLPAAGKTGTTNDYVDAWFVGYTPNLATGVWIGFDKPRTIVSHGFAGELAVPMWARFMKVATTAHKPDTFKAPSGLTAVNVCRLSGQLPGEACDRIITDYFVRGAAPSQVCQEHYFFASSGQLVAVGTGGSEIVPASNQNQAQASDALVSTVSAGTPELVVAADTVDGKEQPKKKRGFWGKIFGRGEKEKD
ncbi:MAG TPA: PBP1A family penicillin-binding protein [Vicinamibacterales bacterium]|nr:PBP1A family penicillin-binding protein [Vicinamibacterales bacterium]